MSRRKVPTDAQVDEVAEFVLCLELERIGPTVHNLDERRRAFRRLVRERFASPAQTTGYRPRRTA